MVCQGSSNKAAAEMHGHHAVLCAGEQVLQLKPTTTAGYAYAFCPVSYISMALCVAEQQSLGETQAAARMRITVMLLDKRRAWQHVHCAFTHIVYCFVCKSIPCLHSASNDTQLVLFHAVADQR
jgi:hypothetical protein